MASWTNILKQLCFPLSTKEAIKRMNILVITACTAKKKWDRQVDLADQLQPTDFATTGFLRLRSRRLEEFETPAAEMYTGDGHLRLMNGVTNLRDTFKQDIIVDVRIISPGYGLLHEEDYIVPYSYNFSDYPNSDIEQRSKKLKIHPKIECSLSRYDLAFFLLSEPYLTACLLPFDVKKPPVQIFLVAEGAQIMIPCPRPYIRTVCAGEELDDQLEGVTPRNRKEVVFEKWCKVACNRGLEVFEEVKRNPQRMIEMVLDCNGGL